MNSQTEAITPCPDVEAEADFYQLDAGLQEQRLRSLAGKALKEWGMSDAPLELIKIRENAVYKTKDARGQAFVVRVHRAGYNTDAELISEFQWMQALNDAGILTPEVIPALDGALFKRVHVDYVPESRQVDVLSWVPGKPLGSIEEGFDGDLDTILGTFKTLGELAARMHNQVEAWSPPAGFTRGAFDLDGLTGPEPRWGRFWENPFLDAEGREIVLQARDRLREELRRFGTGADRFGLIHADLIAENLLVSDTGTRLIDFDDATYGWHLFELATPLVWHLGEDYFDAAVENIVAGYRVHRQLPDEHLEIMTTFLAAKMTTLLGWLTTRSEAAEVQEMGPGVTEDAVAFLRVYLAG